MSCPLLVVCEARNDFALASRLIDRSIEAHGPQWVRDSGLDAAREYFGIDPVLGQPHEPFVRWKNLGSVIDHVATGDGGNVRRLQLDTHQFGESFPEHEDAFAFLRFVRLVRTSDRVRQPDAFILLRDADAKDRTELRKLNSHIQFKRFPAVVGVPDPESECWLLTGFPHEATVPEQEQVAEVQRETGGVHPCRDTHKLRAAHEGEERHPKRVLSRLTGDDATRIAQCAEAAFDLLRTHGAENGLTDFLDQLRDRLVPGLYGGSSSRPSA